MSPEQHHAVLDTLKIPATVMTRPDIARLMRELEALDNTVEAQTLRHQAATMPEVSQMLSETAGLNGCDLADQDGRLAFIESLKLVKNKAPIVHISFAEHPRPDVVQQLVDWMRQNLHPATLIHLGLQPSIGAGCVMRTPSHVYDFSIRAVLSRKKDILLKYLSQGVTT